MSVAKGTASTRLLNMKFMQRAAAAEEKSAPSTPDGRPAKRIRMSNGTASPSTPAALSDQERLRKTQAEEDLHRSAIMAKLAAEAGETHWVLNVKESAMKSAPLAIVHAGFADLDAADDASSESEDHDNYDPSKPRYVKGRMVFGQMKKDVPPPDAKESSDSDGSTDSPEESDEEESDNYRNVRAGYAQRKQDKKSQEQQRLSALRRKKEVNLNRGDTSQNGEHEERGPKWISRSQPHNMQSNGFRKQGRDHYHPRYLEKEASERRSGTGRK